MVKLFCPNCWQFLDSGGVIRNMALLRSCHHLQAVVSRAVNSAERVVLYATTYVQVILVLKAAAARSPIML